MSTDDMLESKTTEEKQKTREDLMPSSAKEKPQAPDISEVKNISAEEAGGKTTGSMMGEIVWLMSQSPTHKHLALSDLEWLLMPPIILNQYKLFRDGKKPVGAALWGYLSPEAEQRLIAVGRIAPQDWGNNAQLDEERGLVPSEGGTLWLVELITPFHTKENKHREQMLADLMQTVFKGKEFKLIQVNGETGKREPVQLKGLGKAN